MTSHSRPTSKQRAEKSFVDHHGKAHVLCIGISGYPKGSKYKNHKQCCRDANDVADSFRKISALNAEVTKVRVITPSDSDQISANRIRREVTILANEANETDRIIFYFSGHGDRPDKNDESQYYLVPQDAYDSDVTSLLAFSQIQSIISSSRAKQKTIIVDACFSGFDTSKFKSGQDGAISQTFLGKLLQSSTGTAYLASSRGDQESTAQSPGGNNSLFTHYLLKALLGDELALDASNHLTMSSLYDYLLKRVVQTSTSYGPLQNPFLEQTKVGLFLLGDFSRPIISKSEFFLDNTRVESIGFTSLSPAKIAKLTKYDFAKFSGRSFVENKVNPALYKEHEKELSEQSANVANHLGLHPDTTCPEEGVINFDTGSYSLSFRADENDLLKSGWTVRSLAFQATWFSKFNEIGALLEIFDLCNANLSINFSTKTAPSKFVSELGSLGWTMVNNSRAIQFIKDDVRLIVADGRASFSGKGVLSIFDSEPEDDLSFVLGAALKVISQR